MSISLSNIKYVYMPGTPFEQTAVDGVTLEVNKGEFVGIIGHTGSGKSTLIQHFNGLLKPTDGSVCVDGVDINVKNNAAKAARRKVGMVFQYPEQQLFEETVYDDIAFGPRNLALNEVQVEERVREAMEFVNLPYDEYKSRSPFRLSGGQMRRVAIAGIIALRPEYLILDEPAAGLDPQNRNDILDKIYQLYRREKIGIIMISHNMDDVAKMATRLVVMNKGRAVLDAAPKQVFANEALLAEAGLATPPLTRLLLELKQNGLPVDIDLFTVEQAVANIMTALRRKC